jgi:hypothetical protein
MADTFDRFRTRLLRESAERAKNEGLTPQQAKVQLEKELATFNERHGRPDEGFLKGLGRAISQPLIRSTQNIGTAGAAIASMLTPGLRETFGEGYGGIRERAGLLGKLFLKPETELQDIQRARQGEVGIADFNRETGREIFEQGIKPAAGVAALAIPVGQAGGLGATALAGGAAGGLFGLSAAPKEATAKETAIQTGVSAATGAATAMALYGIRAGVNKAKRAMSKKLKDFSLEMGRRVTKPETGRKPGWGQREINAEKVLFEKTKGFDPKTVDDSITNTLKTTSSKIRTELAKYGDESIRYDPIADNITKNVDELAGGVDFRSRAPDQVEAARLMAQVQNRITSNATAQPNGAFTLNPSQLFKAKQDVGKFLSFNGVWDRNSAGVATKADRVGMVAYNTLKDSIDDMMITVGDKTIGELTSMEHALYQASNGVYRWGHRYAMQSGGRFSPSALSRILDLLQAGQFAVGRGGFALGTALEKGVPSGLPAAVTRPAGLGAQAIQQAKGTLPAILPGLFANRAIESRLGAIGRAK